MATLITLITLNGGSAGRRAGRAGGPCFQLKNINFRGSAACRDEHGSRLDRTGSGLKAILAGSELDRTAIFFLIGGSGLDRIEKIFFVLM